MSYAGGIFTRLFSYVADANAGITAQPSRFDADLNDMATGLSTCILRDGTGTPTTNIGFGGYKITGLGLGVAPTDAASVANVTNVLGSYLPLAGGALTGAVTGTSAVFSGAVTTAGSRITGTTTFATGSGIEVFFNAGVGTIASQNRDLSTINQLSIFGLPIYLYAGGSLVSVISATGMNINFGILTVANVEVGYKDVPQNPQAAAYTLALTDRGQHIYYTGAAAIITIPANATVAFPIGAAITIVNDGSGVLSLTRAALVTMKLVGTGANLDRSLAIAGIATFIKVGTNTWFLSGTGIT